ncbi:MAG TPA: PLP-dependent aminotransferase family protein [Actinomycetota bacterium]|nr:PLP-dependent aminotransferase family protein [Actinomycetota bacterium]
MHATVARVLAGWEAGDGPLYRRLASAISGAIADGSLPAGERLPTERSLATPVSVSRATVVAAYDALRDAGWVDRRQGSGTWVRHRGPAEPFGQDRPGVVGRSSASFRALIEGPTDAIEFTCAATPAPDLLDDALVRDALAGLQVATGDIGYHAVGHPPLRRALAAHLSSWGLPTSEREVIVTSGAQQAIALTTELYTRPGDVVVVEDPTYLSALDRFAAAGVRLATVPVGPRGVRAAELAAAAADRSPRLMYVIPTFHNPTGTLVPEDERREIARAADALRVPVVEDLTLADLSLGTSPPPPIASFAGDVPVLTIGSLSKLFWGGLRVGFIRGPEPVIQRLARMKLLADHGSSVVSQVVATALLGRVEEYRERRQAFARDRYELLAELLRRHLPSWRWREPEGGLSLWVELPGADATAFADAAARRGVAVVPGPMTSANDAFVDHLRLPFVLPPAAMEEGVRRLAEAWSSFGAEAPGPERSLRVVV